MKKVAFITVVMFFLSGALMRAAVAAQGGQTPQKDMTVGQLKADMIQDIDARIKMLQADRGCVSAARTKEELTKCVQQAGEKRKQLMKKMEARREQRNKAK